MMEKRAFERISVNLQARLFWGSSVYPATVLNVSEGGMLISSMMCPPCESVFEVVILLEDKVLKIPVNVKWARRVEETEQLKGDLSIGVELLNRPQEYIEFIRAIRSR